MKSDGQNAKCLNCGRDTGPRFCPHCGQEAAIRKGSVFEVGREVLSDWLSLDSRLLRSLRTLAAPGKLSEFYVAGKRAPYLRPFRLYLLASLLLFSTVLTLEPPDAKEYDLHIGGELVFGQEGGTSGRQIELIGSERAVGRWMIRLAGDRLDRLRKLERQKIMDLLFSGLRRTLPSTLILFVPFLALALKLLYVRGRAAHTRYLDHMVFALHFQSALFFLLAASWLVIRSLGFAPLVSYAAYGVVGTVILLVYLPLALRRFYGQSRGWTAVKTLAVLGVYKQLSGLTIDLSVLVGIWGV